MLLLSLIALLSDVKLDGHAIVTRHLAILANDRGRQELGSLDGSLNN